MAEGEKMYCFPDGRCFDPDIAQPITLVWKSKSAGLYFVEVDDNGETITRLAFPDHRPDDQWCNFVDAWMEFHPDKVRNGSRRPYPDEYPTMDWDEELECYIDTLPTLKAQREAQLKGMTKGLIKAMIDRYTFEDTDYQGATDVLSGTESDEADAFSLACEEKGLDVKQAAQDTLVRLKEKEVIGKFLRRGVTSTMALRRIAVKKAQSREELFEVKNPTLDDCIKRAFELAKISKETGKYYPPAIPPEPPTLGAPAMATSSNVEEPKSDE